MTQYDNNLTGALFKNERKEKPNQPDYRGSVNIHGQEFWVSGWIKVSKSNDKFLSLSLQEKEDKPQEQKQSRQPAKQSVPARQSAGFDDIDSDIPFRDPLSYRGAHLAA